MARQASAALREFAPMQGRWHFADRVATYLGPDDQGTHPVGVCLSSNPFRLGTANVRLKFVDGASAGRIVIGYNATSGAYYSIGLGGYGSAYVVDSFVPGQAWRSVVQRGDASQLSTNRHYNVVVEVRGQQLSLSVDGVRVIETDLPAPLQGDQAGLFAWGSSKVEFDEFKLSGSDSQIFVIMQFGEPYDALYNEVIQPVAKNLGFRALRADDIFHPGIILQDIRRGIVESDVIVAEITPANPNVFYELGYAHALEKPTILLANKRIDKLPFDVSGYRVIFYDDTIGGKPEVEATLRKHLDNIRKGRVSAIHQ